jgi:predicted transcriptional regulator
MIVRARMIAATVVVVVIAMIAALEMIAVVATTAMIVHVQTIVRDRMIEMAAALRQMQSA